MDILLNGLSRLPLLITPHPELSVEQHTSMLGQMEAFPVSTTQLGTDSSQDPVPSRVKLLTRGWPPEVSSDVKPFYHSQN